MRCTPTLCPISSVTYLVTANTPSALQEKESGPRQIVARSTAPFRPVYHYDEIIPSFKYRWDYKRYPVWTSVLCDEPHTEIFAALERLT